MNSSFMKTLNRSTSTSTNLANHISTFCSSENFTQSLAFLDQELSVYGYPTIHTAGNLNKVALLNVAHDLLLNYRKSLEAHSKTVDDMKHYESDVARLQHLLSLAKEDAANKDRELKSKCVEEAHLQQRIDSLRKKHKVEQEKSRKLSTDLASRDSQFKHERKKKLQEIEKLQGKLHQLLQDKRHERLVGIELLNSLQRTDGKRGKWNTDRNKKNNEQEMYRLIITNYEDSQRQLLSENADMRKYLKQMQDELIAALNEKVFHSDSRRSSFGSPSKESSRRDSFDSVKTSNSEDSEVSVPVSEGVFEMPYNLVKEDIEKSLKSKWKALRRMHKQRSKTEDASKKNQSFKELTDLSQKFEEYGRVIKEQQEVIDYFTSCQGEKKASLPKDAYFLEEKAELDKSKARFFHQRLAFEKERKTYTEALVQLGHDRQDFEEEKAKWLQNKFLQLTPFRSNTSPRKPNEGEMPSSGRRKGLSLSWNGGIKVSSNDATLRSSRGEADGMGQSGASPGSSPPLVPKSPNLRQYYTSPDQINPWMEESPPVPSTCELYRALGLRYHNKENHDFNTENNLLFSISPNPSSACFDSFQSSYGSGLITNSSPILTKCQVSSRSCHDLTKNAGCTRKCGPCTDNRNPFSRSTSLDSMLSYHTPILGTTPEKDDSSTDQTMTSQHTVK